MFKSSEELKNDILIKIGPWMRSIPVPPVPTAEWLLQLESAVKMSISNQIWLYLQDGILPKEIVQGDPGGWIAKITAPIRVMINRPNPLLPAQISIMGLQDVAHEILRPQVKAPVSSFVRAVMAQPTVVAAVGDDFALSQEERALRDILEPTRTIPQDTRTKLAEQLQESLRMVNEQKKKEDERKEAVDTAKFGRILDID